MSFVATAIIGGAVIGGIATTVGANRAAGAAETGAATAADATVQATQLQIAEIQRQFDYQQQLLLPFVQNQYAAQSAYQDLLGIGGGAGSQPPAPGGYAQPGGYADVLQTQPDGSVRIGSGPGRLLQGPNDGGGGGRGAYGDTIQTVRQPDGSYAQDLNAPVYPSPGSTTFSRGDRGQFIDPNIDQTRLADINTLPGEVRGNLLQEGAASTSVYGDVFKDSPGYAFQVEEMGRELDRRNSAGGNYGGRAIMEAQRRAGGLAAGDYYNWARGRSGDVNRLATAEAQDASRLDAAASQEDRLLAVDQQRGDQAYYNYLAQLGAAGGVGGNPTGQAVSSSQAAGGAVAGAYGAQGSGLAGIYSGLGTDLANIQGSQYASYNDIIQGSLSNATAAGYFKPRPQLPAPAGY